MTSRPIWESLHGHKINNLHAQSLAASRALRLSSRKLRFIAVTYPLEWVERYRARGYLNIDPAIQIGLRRPV
ncbi:hypothetical protein EOA86_37845, partial [Mesorhizobium sp. M5C.F.Ca.IN.020.32.2.1]